MGDLSENMENLTVREGDLVQLVGLSHKQFLFRVQVGQTLQTHRGVVAHADLIGQPWGKEIYSHNGRPFFILQPSLSDLLKELPRRTQIMYPKDIGFIIMRLGIGPESRVVEAGTGSGGLTSVFAHFVGSEGKVISYDGRKDNQDLARKNLKRLGLLERVELKCQNIRDGFEERNVESLFLDVPNPEDFIPQVRTAMKTGGFFGALLPTTNQVTRLVSALREHHFMYIEVCELMLRYYKAEPERFRPTDRMVGHTGYLIFARPVVMTPRPDDVESSDKPDRVVDVTSDESNWD